MCKKQNISIRSNLSIATIKTFYNKFNNMRLESWCWLTRELFFSSCNIPAFLPGHFLRERVSPSNFAPYFICMLPIKWTGMESLGKRRRGISQMSKQISVKTRRVQTRHSLLGRIIATNLFLKPCNWTLFLFFFFVLTNLFKTIRRPVSFLCPGKSVVGWETAFSPFIYIRLIRQLVSFSERRRYF